MFAATVIMSIVFLKSKSKDLLPFSQLPVKYCCKNIDIYLDANIMPIDRISISHDPNIRRTARMYVLPRFEPPLICGLRSLEPLKQRGGWANFGPMSAILLLAAPYSRVFELADTIDLDILWASMRCEDFVGQLKETGLKLRKEEEFTFENVAGSLYRIIEEDTLVSRYGTHHDEACAAITDLFSKQPRFFNRFSVWNRYANSPNLPAIDLSGSILSRKAIRGASFRNADTSFVTFY